MKLRVAIKTLQMMDEMMTDNHGKIIAQGGAVTNASKQRQAAVKFALTFLVKEHEYLKRLQAEGVDMERKKKPPEYWERFRSELYGNMSPNDIVEMMGE